MGGFDAKSFARMSAALNSASLVIVTHEHTDHIGGLLAQPNLKDELRVTKLNGEQLANLERYNPGYPKAAFDGYHPVSYEKYLSVAPGVVLIRAAGHTPGSQMVYVKTQSGAEFLFTGDVAWHMRNIDAMRERARLVTWWFLHEDRDAVLAQLTALNALKSAEPKIHIVPGHDPGAVAALEGDGLILKTFH
jgi:glyoxylase-like metal-dependent hydrolase (beta-lactamase superfamily II)